MGLFCQFRHGRHCAFGYTHYLLKAERIPKNDTDGKVQNESVHIYVL